MSSSYKEKIKNAYLLIYERIVPYEEEGVNIMKKETEGTPKKSEEFKDDKDDKQSQRWDVQKSFENSTDDTLQTVSKRTSESTIDSIRKEDIIPEDIKNNIPQQFLQNLMEKNQKFHMHRNVFSREYFDFVIELVTKRQYTPNLTYSENYQIDPVKQSQEFYDLELIKLGVIFLLTATLRDKDRHGITRFLPFLKQQLTQVISSLEICTIRIISSLNSSTYTKSFRMYLLAFGSWICSLTRSSNSNFY